jgi:murein L,D-transpeptidase YcbB/YkuD
MAPLTKLAGTGAAIASLALAAGLLVASGHPADAGIFSWLGGRGQDSGQPQQNRGLFGGRGQGPFQQQTQPQYGERQAPEEGTAETRQWILNPPLSTPTLSARNVEATKAAISRYQGIVASGGWPTVPAYAMRPGSHGQAVEILHRRLEISGDLVGRSVPDEYDQAVVQAVRGFQARHGLAPTGTIDRITVDAMNVPAGVRLNQLQVNLKRLQTLSGTTASRYVDVNIPSAQVEAVQNGQVVQRHAAVVGKNDLQTPELSSKIVEINFNPYWYVPRSIVYNDLVPKGREFARRGQDILAAYRMEAFDSAGNQVSPQAIDWFGDQVLGYNFRQQPWEENSLGFVKINFPNKDSVYMHDTPLKSLFGRNVRFESHGCVRVHDVAALVAWLLNNNSGWDIQRVMTMKQTGEQTTIKLTKPIAVYFTYVTAWATPDGVVNFRPDIYGHDGSSEATASAY